MADWRNDGWEMLMMAMQCVWRQRRRRQGICWPSTTTTTGRILLNAVLYLYWCTAKAIKVVAWFDIFSRRVLMSPMPIPWNESSSSSSQSSVAHPSILPFSRGLCMRHAARLKWGSRRVCAMDRRRPANIIIMSKWINENIYNRMERNGMAMNEVQWFWEPIGIVCGGIDFGNWVAAIRWFNQGTPPFFFCLRFWYSLGSFDRSSLSFN